MTIDPNEKLAGISLILIRDFLRCRSWGGWSCHALVRELQTTPDNAEEIINELVRRELIREEYKRDEVQYWQSTSAGIRLAGASAAPRISRRTADKNLAGLISRAQHVNQSGSYAFYVSRIVVIGSYLTDAPKLSDVDVVISLIRRYTDPTLHRQIEDERRDVALQANRFFRNETDQICWPEVEVLLFLKARSRSLQIVSKSAEFLGDCAQRVVFQFDSKLQSAGEAQKGP